MRLGARAPWLAPMRLGSRSSPGRLQHDHAGVLACRAHGVAIPAIWAIMLNGKRLDCFRQQLMTPMRSALSCRRALAECGHSVVWENVKGCTGCDLPATDLFTGRRIQHGSWAACAGWERSGCVLHLSQQLMTNLQAHQSCRRASMRAETGGQLSSHGGTQGREQYENTLPTGGQRSKTHAAVQRSRGIPSQLPWRLGGWTACSASKAPHNMSRTGMKPLPTDGQHCMLPCSSSRGFADALEAGGGGCLYRCKVLQAPQRSFSSHGRTLQQESIIESSPPKHLPTQASPTEGRMFKIHTAVQWFKGYADALEAGGQDCLYRLKVPQAPQRSFGTQQAERGTHGRVGSVVPCIGHFGLRGPKRPVRSCPTFDCVQDNPSHIGLRGLELAFSALLPSTPCPLTGPELLLQLCPRPVVSLELLKALWPARSGFRVKGYGVSCAIPLSLQWWHCDFAPIWASL